jgi:hypothetical protein
MDYLENLSKQTQKEKKREELYRQTLKNHSATTPVLNVYNDLPEDLIDMNKAFVSSVYPTLPLDPVPYGILKNGSKPTFREWKKTQKNISSLSLTPTPTMNDREKRIADLKTKFASLTTTNAQNQPVTNNTIATNHLTNTSSSTPVLASPINTMPFTNSFPVISSPPVHSSLPVHLSPSLQSSLPVQSSLPLQSFHEQLSIPLQTSFHEQSALPLQSSSPSVEKQNSYVSKKYTLGNKHNIVGVLLKDNKTRKNVTTAQQNLKQKSISQIKEYLKDRNLIKVGSSAPPDVLKQMFESAMLTGEITNSNEDILLHNFMKSEENN